MKRIDPMRLDNMLVCVCVCDGVHNAHMRLWLHLNKLSVANKIE